MEGKTGNSMIKSASKYFLAALISGLVLLGSCKRGTIFADSHDMNNNTWNLMDIPAFTINIRDTVNSHNISFIIRTGSNYPFRNIWFFVTTASPDGRVIGDTIQYYLSDEKGKRLGNGSGDIRELKLPFKSNVYFPIIGDYSISVQHGMRDEDLKGVYDLGLRIEKTGK